VSLGIPAVEGPVGVLGLVKKELFGREERERAVESHLCRGGVDEKRAPRERRDQLALCGSPVAPQKKLALTSIGITVILLMSRPQRPPRRIADVERLLQVHLDTLVELLDEEIPHARPRLPVLVVTQSGESVQRDVESGAEERDLAEHGFLLLWFAGLVAYEDDEISAVCSFKEWGRQLSAIARLRERARTRPCASASACPVPKHATTSNPPHPQGTSYSTWALRPFHRAAPRSNRAWKVSARRVHACCSSRGRLTSSASTLLLPLVSPHAPCQHVCFAPSLRDLKGVEPGGAKMEASFLGGGC
jgi:hypothetical protein